MANSTNLTTTTYGYVHWRSKLNGQEGRGTTPIKDPAHVVEDMNCRFPGLHHWFTLP